MLSLNARERKMVLLAVLVICSAVVYKYFAEPYWLRLKNINRQIEQIESRIERAKQLESAATPAQYSVNTIQNQTGAVASLLEYLEFWSEEAGVNLSAIRPGSIQDKGSTSELHFEIELQGELYNLCRYIELIESPEHISRISRIRITKPQETQAELNAVITLSTLSYPEPLARARGLAR